MCGSGRSSHDCRVPSDTEIACISTPLLTNRSKRMHLSYEKAAACGLRPQMSRNREKMLRFLLCLLGSLYMGRLVSAQGSLMEQNLWGRSVELEPSPYYADPASQNNETHHAQADVHEVIRILEPVDGLLSAQTHLALRFDVHPHDAWRVAVIELRAGEVVTRFNGGVRVMTMHGIEPGTHHVELLALAESGEVLGQTDVMWDTVFPEGQLLQHRLLAPPPPPQTPPPKGPQGAEGRAGRKRKRRLCFVTSLKLDGQRMIYLTQLTRLHRDKYDTMVLSMQPKEGAVHDGVFLSRVKELGVPVVVSEGLSVSIQEAQADLGPGDLTDEGVVAFALSRLQAHGGTLDEQLQPHWVRHMLATLVGKIKAIAPDILVFANGRSRMDGLLSTCASLAGVPHVLLELPNLFPQPPLTGVSLMIAPSHYAARHGSVAGLNDSAGVLPVTVITPGVDETRFYPRGTKRAQAGEDQDLPCHPMCRRREADSPRGEGPCDPECSVVAFLGRLSVEKSPGLFLRMAALVYEAHPSARFLLIGPGDLRVPLERRARLMGLGPSTLSFAGGLFEDLPRVLRSVDVLVNPSLRAWSETFCIANVEGLASGVPVVSFGVGGTGEYLQHGVNSLLVDDATRVQDVADAVLSLLRDPQRREAMALEARRTAEYFTVDRQIQRYEELYDSLV